jgi:hypothetical protein
MVLLLKYGNNNYPMKDWHIKHMQNTIIKYITGLSDSTPSWEARQYMKFYNMANVQKTIAYDAKHGVSREEILLFIELVRTHPTYCDLQSSKLSMGNLNAIEKYVRLNID